jgi:hypothetical protein
VPGRCTLAEPFLLLGEIENYIRRTLEPLDAKTLKSARAPGDDDRPVETVADLSFGEYVRLLENEHTWTKLGLKLDRKEFVDHLDRVRRIRNDVMHFDPDGIAPDDREKLRSFIGLLRSLASVGVI